MVCTGPQRSCVVMSVSPSPFCLIFPSTPRHVARSFTPALVCARILAVVEDSLDSADGLGVEFTLDSFRRVVASIPRKVEAHPGCTDVIVVRVIHHRP